MSERKLNRYEKAFLRTQERMRSNAKKKMTSVKVKEKKDSKNILDYLISIFDTKPKRKKEKKKAGIVKNFFFVLAILIMIGLSAVSLWFISLEIPDVSNFSQRKISNSTKIYDRTGEILLYDIHENIQRTVVDLDEINKYAVDAIVAIEDHTFYEHNGVVIKSTARAVLQTILSRLGLSNEGTSGGSTLTQQVVKNTLLDSRRQVSRKVKEWILAYKIEQRLTKDEILEIYLNEAPYGGTLYGIEKASNMFFGIPASDLTLGQSAYLAAIPNLPTFYSPYGPNKDKLDIRQRIVLQEMKRHGFITDQEYRDALEEKVEFLLEEETNFKALHFVQYVRSYLEEKYGKDIVENGGLKVVTTLDYKLQQKAEQIIKEHIEEVESLHNASNAALVALDANTGQILTMVGSRDYFDEDIDGNFNVTLANRQPGSSFKPIAYANAFEKGYLPQTILFDTPTQFNAGCDATRLNSENNCYSPRNYDGEFKGPLSMKNALAQSRNIPAVKALYLGGLEDTMKLARNLGITSLNRKPSFYGLSLVLGGGEVSLLEMTGAYSVFANDGVFNKPTGILLIEDSEGEILEEFEAIDVQAIETNTARMIADILSDNQARTPLFGSNSFLYFGGKDVAGKTGTTNDNRDAWLIGFTPDVALGVWTGNNDNTPMTRGSAITGKPWRAFMDEIIKEYDTGREFSSYSLPEDIDSYPAMVRGEWERPGTLTEQSLDENGNQINVEITDSRFGPHTILHFINKENPRVLNQQRSDPQYSNWETSVRNYVAQNFSGQLNEQITPQNPEENEPSFTLSVRGIENQEVFLSNDEISLRVRARDIEEEDIEKVDFYVNGVLLGTDSETTFEMMLDLQSIDNINTQNSLQIVAYSTDGISESETFTFFVQE